MLLHIPFGLTLKFHKLTFCKIPVMSEMTQLDHGIIYVHIFKD